MISGTLLGMKLRSVVLVAFALLLFGTPARADTVVFTPGSLGVDFSLNDNLGFYVTSAGIAPSAGTGTACTGRPSNLAKMPEASA